MKTLNETIMRMAKSSDIQQILPLIEQLGYPQEFQDFQKRVEEFLDETGYGIAVIERNEKILGLIAWSKSRFFLSNKARIHIVGLVVDEHHRGQGLGKALVSFVEEFAKQFSPCIIDLTSGLRRAKDGTHEFYKSIGYQNEGYMAKLYLRKEV